MGRYKTVYTADHEEPICIRCDHLNDYSCKQCAEECGAENFWNAYRRTEFANEENEQDKTNIKYI